MEDHPDFDGYLWIGDDVWLNFPQLLTQMDLDKIWLNPENETNYLDPQRSKKGWHWSAYFGLPAWRKHYASISERFRRRSKYAFGEDNMVIKSYSDVVYIPKRFMTDFIAVARLVPDVIFETAVPTALHLISRKEDHQYFSDALYLWYGGERTHVWDYWSVQRSFIHPIKLSDRKLRGLSTNWTMQCIQTLTSNYQTN